MLHLKNINIYLSVPSLICGIWNLVPQPRIEPMTPALGAQSLSHWTTREVPWVFHFSLTFVCVCDLLIHPACSHGNIFLLHLLGNTSSVYINATVLIYFRFGIKLS